MSMTKNDIGKYDERHRFWTDQAISQFGTTTNLFFIISMAFLAFLAGQKQMATAFIINSSMDFSLSTLLFALGVISSFLSVFASGITVWSRLHDLRLTRHTIWIRKKYYESYQLEFPDNHVDLSNHSLWIQLGNFLSTILKQDYFITDIDIDNDEKCKKKFTALRKRNLLLARFSWKSMNFQILTLLIGLILYVLSNII